MLGRVGKSHSSSSDDFKAALKSKQAEKDCLSEIMDCFGNFGVRLPEEKVFRYANFHNFDSEMAIEGIREDASNPHMKLKMDGDLDDQFETKALFPLPKLRTRKTNSEVVYMRLSRFDPNESDIDKLIESLCYVFNDMSQTEEQCRNGVAVICNMKNINRKKFNKDACYKLMQALQGHKVPTCVSAFIIVNAPQKFGKLWKITMRTMISREFSRKVHMIQEERLAEFLMHQYELCLPDDLHMGYKMASELVEDYVDLKIMEEKNEQ